MTERQRGLTLADVDGLPPIVPAEKFPLPAQTPYQAVLAIVVALWATDPDFVKMCISVSNATARSRFMHSDREQAAQKIWAFAVANKVTVLTSLDEPQTKGVIAHKWLKRALEKGGYGRQAILLQMRQNAHDAEERRAAAAAARGAVETDEADQAA